MPSRQEIWTIDADGTGAKPLVTDETASATEPAWAPDGTHLAFTLTPASQDSDIYLANADGTGLQRLTDHAAEDTSAAWSRDGSFVAFTSSRDFRNEIYVMAADGTDQRRLSQSPEGGGAWDATWGPDLAFP